MKSIIVFLFCLFSCFIVRGQAIQQRSSPTITVMDANAFTSRSFRPPAFADTIAANIVPQLDSAGKIIYTFDCNCVWLRQNNPKKWVHINSTNGNNGSDTLFAQLPRLFFDSITRAPSTIIKFRENNNVVGGIVTIDSCRNITVAPGISTINFNGYSFPLTMLVVPVSDPSNPRQDYVISDTFGVVSILTGTPGSPALPPSFNPSSQFVLASYTIGAGASCLGVRQDIIYDGIADDAGQWNFTTSGTMTADFVNTDNPYHLNQALFVSKYTDQSSIIWTKPSGNDTVLAGSVIKIPLYFNGIMNNQIQVQFYFSGIAVSSNLVINPYFNINDSNQYQIPTIPLSAWSFPGGIKFDQVIFTFAGDDTSGAKGIYFDWIQIQFGNNNVSNALVLTTNGSSGASTLINNVLNIPVYSGGGASSLQQATDKTISLGDDPYINNHGNTFSIDSSSFNSAGYDGLSTGILSSTPTQSQMNNTYNFISGTSNSGASVSTATADTSTVGINLATQFVNYLGVSRTNGITISPTVTQFSTGIDNDIHTTVVFQNVDTLLTPPTYVYVPDADTLKVYPFPSVGTSFTDFKERFTGSTSTAITLSHTPLYPLAVKVFLNGVLQDTPQYSLTGTALTLAFTPVTSDVFTLTYLY